MIAVSESMHEMLAVFANVSRPLAMSEAISLAMWPTARLDDTYRWGRLMGAVADLVGQGLVRVVGAGDSFRDDRYEVTDVGLRIASYRTAENG